MINLQATVNSLMTLLLNGGTDAAIELFKGMVVNGAEAVSKIWRDIFSEKPESYPLADRVARNPEDPSARQELRALLEKMLAQRPELLEQVQQTIITGDIKADQGSVAAGVIQDSDVTIKNR